MEDSHELQRAKLEALEAFYQASHWERVIRVGGEVLEEEPDCAIALALVGLAKVEMGEKDAGRKMVEAALEAAPNSAFCLNAMSHCAIEQGNVGEAFDFAGRALEIEPDNVESLLRKAWIHLRREEVEAAGQLANEALRLDPDNANARNLLAVGSWDSGTPEGAATIVSDRSKLGHLLDALEREPNDPMTLNNLGNYCLRTGGDARAEEFYRSALSADPQCEMTRANLLVLETKRDSSLPWIFFPIGFLPWPGRLGLWAKSMWRFHLIVSFCCLVNGLEFSIPWLVRGLIYSISLIPLRILYLRMRRPLYWKNLRLPGTSLNSMRWLATLPKWAIAGVSLAVCLLSVLALAAALCSLAPPALWWVGAGAFAVALTRSLWPMLR